MNNQVKKLLSDSVIYGLGYIFSRFLTFLLLPLHTNVFNDAQYGLISMGYLFLGIIKIFYTYGLDSAFLRFYELDKERQQRRVTFSTAFWSLLISSALLSVGVVVFHQPIAGFLFEDRSLAPIVLLLGGILFADSLNILPRVLLRIQERAVAYTLVTLLNVSVTLGLNIYLIVFLNKGVPAVFVANVLASLAVLLVLLPLISRQTEFTFSPERWKALLKFGIPLIPAGIASMILELIDRLLLKEFINLEAVGVYSAGYKLGIFMMLAVTAFYYAWQPFFMKAGQQEDGPQIFSTVFSYFNFVVCGLFLLLTFFVEYIVRIELFGATLLGEQFWNVLPMVPIIFLAYIFYGGYINFLPGVYLEGKSSRLAIFTGTGAGVNILGNILLIPVIGIYGAAWSTVFGYATMAILLYFTHQQLYPTPYEWNRIIKTVLITTILWGIYHIISPGWPGRAVLFLLYPLSHLVLGFLRPAEILSLLQRFRSRENK